MKAHRSNIRCGPWRCGSKRPLARGDTDEVRAVWSGNAGPRGRGAHLRAGPRSRSSGGLPWISPPIGMKVTFNNGTQHPLVIFTSSSCRLGRGGSPWLAVRFREADVGRERCEPPVRRSTVSIAGISLRVRKKVAFANAQAGYQRVGPFDMDRSVIDSTARMSGSQRGPGPPRPRVLITARRGKRLCRSNPTPWSAPCSNFLGQL